MPRLEETLVQEAADILKDQSELTDDEIVDRLCAAFLREWDSSSEVVN